MSGEKYESKYSSKWTSLATMFLLCGLKHQCVVGVIISNKNARNEVRLELIFGFVEIVNKCIVASMYQDKRCQV